jgi:biotin transport system substrate-specific component
MIAGNLGIYVIGVPVLAIFLGWANAFRYGLLPFLVGDTIKILIATALLPSCWSVLSFLAQKKKI